MTISFRCPACLTIRNAPAAMAGRRVRCPECDALVEVRPLTERSGRAEIPKAENKGSETIEMMPVTPSRDDLGMLEEVDPFPSGVAAPKPQVSGPPRQPPTFPTPEGDHDEPPKVKRSQLVETEMDMTPMVDATFQLLIFFMITAAFSLQKSKEIPKPKSDQASTNVVVQQEDQEAAHSVVVRIDEFSSYLVINADGDEEEAPSVVDLHTKLRKAHDGDSEGRIPTTLRVEVHDEALHDRVITAIDAGNDVGFAQVELASIVEDS